MRIDLGDLQTLHYSVDNPGEEGIAIITLDRAETRNAQNRRMTYELNACYDDAVARKDVMSAESLLAQAKADHQARLKRSPYVCPIPDDVTPPIGMSAD